MIEWFTGHDIRSSTMHLQCSDGSHDHCTLLLCYHEYNHHHHHHIINKMIQYIPLISQSSCSDGHVTYRNVSTVIVVVIDLRSQTRVSALDIEELLHTDIRTKTSFGDTEAILQQVYHHITSRIINDITSHNISSVTSNHEHQEV
jgi:hypothetical protein